VRSAYANAFQFRPRDCYQGNFNVLNFSLQSDLQRWVDSRWALSQISGLIIDHKMLSVDILVYLMCSVYLSTYCVICNFEPHTAQLHLYFEDVNWAKSYFSCQLFLQLKISNSLLLNCQCISVEYSYCPKLFVVKMVYLTEMFQCYRVNWLFMQCISLSVLAVQNL